MGLSSSEINKQKGSGVLIRVDRSNHSWISHPRHKHPPLDLLFIQSGLQKIKCSTYLIDMWGNHHSIEKISKHIISTHVFFAIIKAYSWCIQETIALGKYLRNHNIITIAVGQHVHCASILCKEKKSFVNTWSTAFDYSIMGNPETECIRFISQLLNDSDNVSCKRYQHFQHTYEPDIKDLPFPQFTYRMMIDYAFPFPVSQLNHIKKWAYIQTSWGCPHNCLHCSGAVRKSYGKKLYKRNPSTIIEEIRFHIQKGAQAICFEDDALFTDKDHIRLLLQQMQQKSLNIPWMAHARPDELDESILKSAASSGLKLLKIGVESGSPKQIEIIEKATCGKEWIAQVKHVFKLLKQFKIASVAMFMIGTPEETVSDIDRSISLARDISPDYIQVQRFTPYLDTRFYQTLSKKDRRTINTLSCYHYSFNKWSDVGMSEKQFNHYHIHFYRSFYLRVSFIMKFLKKNKFLLAQKSFLIERLKNVLINHNHGGLYDCSM